jgi:hypothetical protein
MTREASLADKLQPYVIDIKKSYEAGNVMAGNIIKWYEMHRVCPGDPGAAVLCEQFLNDWLASRPAP